MSEKSAHFLSALIREHLDAGRHTYVATRFPPEPNGYLHIGHAKSICLNFGLAQEFGGRCHLRFDDTNPATEETEYVESIQADIKWLGFDWGEHLYFASDYFEQMYRWAEDLIRAGKAYVDAQSTEEIRATRGSLTEAGTPGPYRDRPIEESLDLFRRMRAGEFPDGAMVLRAKIDLANPNMIMRDPLLYRIRHAHHHRSGDAWCIYPMYDYAHCLEDAIEGITHSICTLEFENNREIYDWLMANVDVPHQPRQYEFARLAVDYMITSKRKLRKLVENGTVTGWDDPRMPTIAGLRRRGVPPSAIRAFCDMVGVTKANTRIDFARLEYAIRNDLNPEVPRVMAIVDPLKVVVTNYPEDQVEWLDASLYPHDVPKEGHREVPFSRELWIERDDFREAPPKKFFRLAPGREVRLRYGYFVTCTEVIKDADGTITALHCTYDPSTRGGAAADGRKVKGTLHWLSAAEAVPAELRLYDRLFAVPAPGGDDWEEQLNPESLVAARGYVEPSIRGEAPGSRYQFERTGYFASDPDSTPDALVFNRIVTLRDTWAKITGDKTPEPAVSAPARAKAPDTRPTKMSKTEIRERIRAANPELAARFARYQAEWGLSAGDADVLSGDAALAEFFEAAVGAGDDVALVTKWVINEVLRELKEREVAELPFTPVAVAQLAALVEAGTVSATAGKEIFGVLAEHGGDPEAIMFERGLEQMTDRGKLAAAVDAVIAAHPDNVQRFRDGNPRLIGFFIGQVMKQTGGKADPQQVRSLVAERLDSSP